MPQFIVCGLSNREPLALVKPPSMRWQNLPAEGILVAHDKDDYIAAVFHGVSAAEQAIARTNEYFRRHQPDSPVHGGWLVFQLQPAES